MEARALHDFPATGEDELAFQKGTLLKIFGITGDWLKAECEGREGFIPANYVKSKPHEWFAGRVQRKLAELILESDGREGSFLIRESESTPGDFSLSVNSKGNVQHFKVLRDGAGKYFLWIVKFNSLNQLVEYHRTSSVSRTEVIYLREEVKEMKTERPERKPTVRALYDFNAEEEGELSFKKDDEIVVLGEEDSNWWKGYLNGKTGIFPIQYVKKILH